MSVKRVLLHFGMPKAGSTSIQHTLSNNTALLEKNNIKYLTEWGVNHLNIFHNLFSPCPVSPKASGHLGKPHANVKQKNKKNIEKMLKAINTANCETLILSGEFFHELYLDSTLDNINTFLNKYFHSKGIETTIIYFIRNPLTWLISFLQQRVSHDGYMNKNDDFFQFRIKQYEGIFNLKKHFPDSLLLLSFEDACLDKDGLVGFFLKKIGFPENEIKELNIYRMNESKCMELMEFIYYIESVEPRYPYKNYKHFGANRSSNDLKVLKTITGSKFDLAHSSKLSLWKRLWETVLLLKENIGIDYTNYDIPPPCIQKTYSEETIEGFIKVFPKLNYVLQKHFLRFFEMKYMETADVKFKQLFDNDSIPYTIFTKKIALFYLPSLRIKNRVLEIIPHQMKKSMKWL